MQTEGMTAVEIRPLDPDASRRIPHAPRWTNPQVRELGKCRSAHAQAGPRAPLRAPTPHARAAGDAGEARWASAGLGPGHPGPSAPAWRRRLCWEGATCPPGCTCLGHGPPGQPLRSSPALRGGWEAWGNELAEISRAAYLPQPACSHKSQNRVPGRDVNSEMQGQLQRKIVEGNRQESCLLSPRVSEGSLEQARARRGHFLGPTPSSPNRLQSRPP